MKTKILIVDDTPANLTLLTDTLEPEGYEVLAAPNGELALKIATRALPDLILLDVMMPGRDGFEVCRELKESATTQEIPILFITGMNEPASISRGFAAGGVDYILKPFHSGEVVSRVATHLKIAALARELREKNARLEAEIERRLTAEEARQRADERLSTLAAREAEHWGVAGLIGKSKTVGKILQDIERLHQFASTSVLITGESGTGKELIARAIHFGSPRLKGPFIPVNCVAIPADLAESMLFGHIRGAFTGATVDRKGFFEQAHGGTLFLDEIGDMPPALQGKLLRVLEDGCITPLGASQSKRVDVRVLSATNVDLGCAIEAGTFRQDLYFRLARYIVETPPLHQRSEDIPLLAAHFLRLFATEMGLKPPELTPDALAALTNYAFPGNIRELKNIIERALIESGGGTINSSHIHLQRPRTATLGSGPLPGGAPRKASPIAEETPSQGAAPFPAEMPLNLEQAEEILIQRALAQTGGNIAEAARLLGVHRTRIYRKMG